MNTIPGHLTDSDGERNQFLKFKFFSISCPLPLLRFLGSLAIVVFILAGCAQRRVDAQMEELCRKDGGIEIYEHVPLPGNQLDRDGNPAFFVTWNVDANGYKFMRNTDQIKSDYPSLSKSIFLVIRESDSKVLGRYVTYLRVGGHILPSLGPDPSKRCPYGVDSNSILSGVFISGEAK